MFVVDYDPNDPGSSFITLYSCLLPLHLQANVALCYFEACNTITCTTTSPFVNGRSDEGLSWSTCMLFSTDKLLVTFAEKKEYKPVAQKVWPILGTLPSHFHIRQNITSNPLANLPMLPTHLPPFVPFSHYTEEWCIKIDDLHPQGFLWPAEQDLIHHFIALQNEGFAWDDSECGHFCEDFFPPVEIPVVAHMPWVEQNIPILPGIYNEVCWIICVKMDAGVYEHSNSSYQSCWFCITKKDGMSLHLVHSLEPLNAITIQHSSVTPFTKQITKQFMGCACGGLLDLYVGYDEYTLTEISHGTAEECSQERSLYYALTKSQGHVLTFPKYGLF